MSPTPPPPPTAVGSGSEGILCRAHADEDLIVVWSGRAAADRASASCSLRRLRPFAFLHRIVATRSIWTLGTGFALPVGWKKVEKTVLFFAEIRFRLDVCDRSVLEKLDIRSPLAKGFHLENDRRLLDISCWTT
ncbi:hypothetical protein QTP88_016564 [Uroleucon formosanum]